MRRALASFVLVLFVSALLVFTVVAATPVAPAGAQADAPRAQIDAPPVQTGGPQARIVDFEFAPTALTVGVNTRVKWTNTGSRPHTVTDRGGTFDTDPIAPGAEGSVAFTVPGTYHYFCRINPSRMNGVIVVEPSGPTPVHRMEAVDPALPGERLRFVPDQLQTTTGSAILFANVGGSPHTLTADDRSFDSGILAPGPEGGRFAGTNATVALTKPGVFTFHCAVHPDTMKGTITVTGQARASPAGASPAPAKVSLEMADFSFSRPEVSIAPGGELTWRNAGEAPHTATFDDAAIDTGNVAPGASAALAAPTRPGSYSYRCNLHPDRMRGVVVVVGPTTGDPTRRAAATGPPAATGSSGPGGGVSAFVLATAVIGAFLGGFGVSAFARRRPGKAEGSRS